MPTATPARRNTKATAANRLSERRWAIVQNRRPDVSCTFIYAVKTTGIYCLPGCASRLPKRANVLFFDSPGDAQAAGFRACRRCCPDQLSGDSRAELAVRAACQMMEASREPVRLEALASAARYTPGHFHRLFKRITGITPKAYTNMLQTQRIQTALPTADNITKAVHRTGHNSSSPFYRNAAKVLGMKPTTYQQGAVGERIEIAAAETYLGTLLLAATERGVCAIEIGKDVESLEQKLRERFAQATLQPASLQTQTWLAELIAHLEQPQQMLEFPLDVQGTVFQRKVWEALQQIPAGKTVTYSQLAQQLGKPKAVRAVASACAANKLALAIPCHRAVRADAQPSGYRWGLERKAELLKREAKLYQKSARRENVEA